MNGLVSAAGADLADIGPGRADLLLVPPPTPACELLPLLRLDQVQAFLVLAEELHFGRASERLFLSQSGLTRRIAALEADLGRRLLERSTRSAQLTEAGLTFLPFALDLVDQARQSVVALQ